MTDRIIIDNATEIEVDVAVIGTSDAAVAALVNDPASDTPVPDLTLGVSFQVAAGRYRNV